MSSLTLLRNSFCSAAAAASMTGSLRSVALCPLSVARRFQSTSPTPAPGPVAPEAAARPDTFGTGLGIFATDDASKTSVSTPAASADRLSTSSPNPSYQPGGQTNLAFARTPDAGFNSTEKFINAPRHFQQNAIDYYILHVQASFNNTLVTITNHQGDAVAMSSGGKAGFKKANRAGYEPAYQATRQVLSKLENKLGDTAHTFGLHVKLKGFGPGRDAAWKCVLAHGWRVKAVEDVTPVAHGGCRPRKARRL